MNNLLNNDSILQINSPGWSERHQCCSDQNPIRNSSEKFSSQNNSSPVFHNNTILEDEAVVVSVLERSKVWDTKQESDLRVLAVAHPRELVVVDSSFLIVINLRIDQKVTGIRPNHQAAFASVLLLD